MFHDVSTTTDRSGRDRPLPAVLDSYATYGLVGLLVGTVLCLLAPFTNPVPDPSFPWFDLPASFRLPGRQPRIEHWPVTYTVGIWLWIAGFPAVFLAGFRRYGHAIRRGATVWLAALPTLAMLGWTTYCRFFWPKPQPPTWNAPAYTFVCWAYCATYDAAWSDLAFAFVGLGVVAAALAWRGSRRAPHALLTFGVLALPLGLPALYEGYRRLRDG